MALLSIFGRQEKDSEETEPPAYHCTMVPYWDVPGEIGNEKRIAGYRCPACGQEFTITAGARFVEAERRRLKQEYDLDEAPKK